MKAILEFNLPEDEESHSDALNGSKYKFILQHIDSKLRSLEKHSDVDSISIDEVRTMIYNQLNEYNIELY